ncbi:GtrA family protein [uncultured Ruminococcus sp.]|uniref:GtrA family protein n=1 Tax=uncultured Ruminococcus sp. TaxID=165186 RepID=UPI00261AE195|nr:GtrA family protein [uncultured Ruminococcus sp.]
MERFILWVANHLPKPLRNLYFRYEDLILYLIFGGLTTVVSFVTQFVPAYFLGTGAAATIFCTTFSWICAVTFAFFTNKKYVFKSKTATKRAFWTEFFSFYGARLVSYFLELGIMLVFATWLGLNYYVVKICAQVFIVLSNYLFSKLFVFKKREGGETAGEGK